MDLFEILFVLVFILLPLMEGIARKRRGAGKSGPAPRPDRPETEPGAGERAGQVRGPTRSGSTTASEMLPDDLWEVLTGERRSPSTPLPQPAPEAEAEEAWSSEGLESEIEEGEIATSEVGAGEWVSAPWEHQPASYRQAESLEYEGPEAVSLEVPLPSPETRHYQFHETLDRTARTPARRRSSALVRALRDPAGLRQAVVLKEVLGPPKGLE